VQAFSHIVNLPETMEINKPASFGTVSERIGDESLTRRRTAFVPYKILWFPKCAVQHPESSGISPVAGISSKDVGQLDVKCRPCLWLPDCKSCSNRFELAALPHPEPNWNKSPTNHAAMQLRISFSTTSGRSGIHSP
jgi:hypothetical protein